MSLRDWVQYGWLTEHKSSREEIKNLLGLAHRDLRACQVKGLDADWRFAIAYNAALQAATAALAATAIALLATPTITECFSRLNTRSRAIPS